MTAAPEEQREELLNDLLKFSNLGIPDFRAAYLQVYQTSAYLQVYKTSAYLQVHQTSEQLFLQVYQTSEQLFYRYTRLQLIYGYTRLQSSFFTGIPDFSLFTGIPYFRAAYLQVYQTSEHDLFPNKTNFRAA